MKEMGMKFTCNRCGKKKFYSYAEEFHGDTSEWKDLGDDVHLCPMCHEIYKDTLTDFMDSHVGTVSVDVNVPVGNMMPGTECGIREKSLRGL